MTIPLEMISTAVSAQPIAHRLAERLERQVFVPARSIGVDVPVVAVTDPPPPTEAKRSPKGTWWVASTFELDPVAQAGGGFTKAPAEIVAGLHSMRKAGVDFDYVYVLNELPPEWRPGTPAPKMRLASADAMGAVQAVRTQETVFAIGIEALRLTAQAVGVAVRGTATVGAAAVAGIGQAVVLDPVILGGIQDPESDRIAWVTLAAWDEVPR